MSRYINADAVEVIGFTDREGSFSDGVQWLLEYIDKLPPADVQPIRRGHWIEPSRHGVLIYDERVYRECDQCHEVVCCKDMIFCPRCGSKNG